ncbi:MAG: M28 family peptidase [Anaerolineales bacterium]
MRIAIIFEMQYLKKLPTILQFILITALMFGTTSCTDQTPTVLTSSFDQERAFDDLVYQVNLGPRVVGSEAHQQFRHWIIKSLTDIGWDVQEQALDYAGQEVFNIIAKREPNNEFPWIILGAHYDSRVVSDHDPNFDFRATPVPGANDGASGVAVLLELARILPEDLNANIWFVLFDAEDNGSLPGSDWILGSRAFVDSLEEYPDAVVIVDMVGDKDLNVYIEKNSNIELAKEIWEKAESLGYAEEFINLPNHRLIDDHLPFMQAGIPAVDIIDFDYPYWHTTADTTDNVSPQSLKVVGEIILAWLLDKYGSNQ